MKKKQCENCEEAKKAFILISKVGLKNVSVVCDKCGIVWRFKDE